jgi:Nuclease-related domain
LIPGTRSNIDHIWVAPTGVWVVDAKAYQGKLVRRGVGPLWRPDNEVYVRGRNQTKLAKGVMRQVEAVIAALGSDPDVKGTHIHGALCFTHAEWGAFDFPFQVGNVWVMYPGALPKRLKKSGPLTRELMEHIARRLDLSLPPAA